MVEAQRLRLSCNEGSESGRGSGLTRPADILLYHHCCVDLVSVSLAWGGWMDSASAVDIVEQAKRDKHTQTCACHRFDFLPFNFQRLALSALQRRSSLIARADDIVSMPELLSGRPMFGFTVASLSRVCEGWQANLWVVV